MAEYILAKDLTIPAGTSLSQPAPLQKQNFTYASARFSTELEMGVEGIEAHFQIPLDEALKAGLVKERG